MATWDIHVKGMDRLLRMMVEGGNDVAKWSAQAMNEEAALIFRESQREVPKDEGILQGSGTLELAKVTGHEVLLEIYYGGNAEKYALRLHEVEMQNYSKPGSKRFYLKDPVERHERGLMKRITDRVEAKLKAAL